MDNIPLVGRHISLNQYDDEYMKFLLESYKDYNSRYLYTSDASILSEDKFFSVLKKKINNVYESYFVITSNKSNRPVGFIYSYDYDKTNGHLYTAIYVIEEMRSKGVALEAGVLFFNYIFSSNPIRKIYCTVYDYNKKSFNFLNDLGFDIEGKLEEHKYFDDKYYDMYLMSLTRENFKPILHKYSSYISKQLT